MLVSFIIPVLNGERYIARCLAAIRKQEMARDDYEVIIIDNGSTDATQEIVRTLGFRLNVVRNATVGGLRNAGVNLSKGEFLAFVDADVEVAPHWLKNGLAALQSSDVVAAGCFPHVPRPATWVQRHWELHQRGNNVKGAVAWLPSMNLLMRRDVFEKVRGFNANLETAEDVDLCYRASEYGIIVNDPSMDAVHWGEARDLKTFWRKEVWRGLGNVAGVVSHGLRRDELPSVGYPLYIICVLMILTLTVVFPYSIGGVPLAPLAFGILVLPAFLLALKTIHRSRSLGALPGLFLLYLVYGLARAYSILRPRSMSRT